MTASPPEPRATCSTGIAHNIGGKLGLRRRDSEYYGCWRNGYRVLACTRALRYSAVHVTLALQVVWRYLNVA